MLRCSQTDNAGNPTQNVTALSLPVTIYLYRSIFMMESILKLAGKVYFQIKWEIDAPFIGGLLAFVLSHPP